MLLRNSRLAVLAALCTTGALLAAEYDLSWFTIDGGGVTTSSGGDFELGGTIGQIDAGVLTGGEFELTGGFWSAVTNACSETGPQVLHLTPAPAGSLSWPCTGYIDPRMESNDGVEANLGLSELVFVFNEPVLAVGGGPVAAASFEVTHSGIGAPPGISSVEQLGSATYRVVLDRIITMREWTTVRAQVQNACGAVIENNGNLGPGVREIDRIDVGRLPGDVNNDGIASPADLINLRQFIASILSAPCGADADYYDIDRDGFLPEPEDLIRFRQLISGTGNSTTTWSGVGMNAGQP